MESSMNLFTKIVLVECPVILLDCYNISAVNAPKNLNPPYPKLYDLKLDSKDNVPSASKPNAPIMYIIDIPIIPVGFFSIKLTPDL